MKIKTIFEGHTAETRYPVAIGDIQGDPASLRGVTVSLWRMTAAILASLIITIPAFATDPDPTTTASKKTVASKYYVDTTKQDIIPTDRVLAIDPDGTEDDVYVPAIVTTNAAGTELNGNSVGLMGIENVGAGYNGFADFEGHDDLVPTVGLVNDEFLNVYDELDMKQGIIPGGTDGNVVTYTGVEGEVGSATVSSGATYSNNTLQNGSDIANIAAVETKQSKLTCAGYVDGHEGDLDYCWLYGEVEVACKATNESCEYNGECCSNNCFGKNGKNKTCFGSGIGL